MLDDARSAEITFSSLMSYAYNKFKDLSAKADSRQTN